MPGVPLGAGLTMPKTEAPVAQQTPPMPMQQPNPLMNPMMNKKRPMKHKVKMNPMMFQQGQQMPTLNK